MLRVGNEMSRHQCLEDLVDTMEIGLRTLIPHSAHALHRADERRRRLDLTHGTSFDDETPVPVEAPFGDPVIGKAARLRQAGHDAFDLRAMLSVPMLIEGDVLGTIPLWRGAGDPFDDQQASLLCIFDAHAGSELRRTEMAAQRRELHLGGIRALVSTVDVRDPFTRGHSARVGRLSRLIGGEMRMPISHIGTIEVAGLLHDIAKIGIPDAILQKPGPLDDHERAVMMGHADLGARILQVAQSHALETLAPLIRHHHEWWDGRGYPAGLRGAEIPIGAQIITVADAWDTTTNDRPYRHRLAEGDAWAVHQERAGTQFAPMVTDALGRQRRNDELVLNGRSLQEEVVKGERSESPPARTQPLGDLRSLGILVDLARATSHLTDSGALLREVTALLNERLDVSVALILESDGDEAGVPETIAWHEDGFEILRCEASDLIDRILANNLPSSMQALEDLPEHPALSNLLANPHNTGAVGVVLDGLPRGVIFFQPSQENRYWRLSTCPASRRSRRTYWR